MSEANSKGRGTSAAQQTMGPWLSREALDGLPLVKRDFDRNRDPLIRAQMQDLEKEAAQETEDARAPRRLDKPKPALRPKGALRRAADRAVQVDGWLARQREAAMAKAQDQKPFGRDELAPRRSVRTRHR